MKYLMLVLLCVVAHLGIAQAQEDDPYVEFAFPYNINYFAWSADGEWLGIATEQGIHIYDSQNQLVQIIADAAFFVSWHPNNSALMTPSESDYSVLMIWNRCVCSFR